MQKISEQGSHCTWPVISLAPSKVIQDRIELHAVDYSFQIPDTGYRIPHRWNLDCGFQSESGLPYTGRVIMRFWETAHLLLPEANINAYFSLKAKFWLREGVGGQFPRSV